MNLGRILVTGGAGFVGGNIAVALAQRNPNAEIIAFDNLSRRGSAANLPRLRDAGVTFVEGDLRDADALPALGRIDALVECSADPTATPGAPDDVVRTNLMGAYHCVELARRDNAQVVFLSTSRVYPVRHLLGIELDEARPASRFPRPRSCPA